jgi:hypothetical protein
VRRCVEARSARIALDVVTIVGIRGRNHLQNLSWDSGELTLLAEVFSELRVQVCQLVKESESQKYYFRSDLKNESFETKAINFQKNHAPPWSMS